MLAVGHVKVLAVSPIWPVMLPVGRTLPSRCEKHTAGKEVPRAKALFIGCESHMYVATAVLLLVRLILLSLAPMLLIILLRGYV